MLSRAMPHAAMVADVKATGAIPRGSLGFGRVGTLENALRKR